MTWNELIQAIQEIPEHRREEDAVFFDRDEEVGYTIDSKEELSLTDGGAFDATNGNDDDGTTFIISC